MAFNKNYLYDSCRTPDCKETTSHKTGYCPTCRTRPCTKCGVPVMSQTMKESVCQNCKKQVKKKAKIYEDI